MSKRDERGAAEAAAPVTEPAATEAAAPVTEPAAAEAAVADPVAPDAATDPAVRDVTTAPDNPDPAPPQADPPAPAAEDATEQLARSVAAIEGLSRDLGAEAQRAAITALGGTFADNGAGFHTLTLCGLRAEASQLTMLPAAWCATARRVILDAAAAPQPDGEAA